MACEPFLQASIKAKALNAFIWFSIFCAWASTLNCFGDHLFIDRQTFAVGSNESQTLTVYVYWDHFTINGNSFSFSEGSNSPPNGLNNNVDECTGAGRGLLAMTVFSFLFLLPLLTLNTCRLVGIYLSFGGFGVTNIEECLYAEFVLAAIVTSLEFLAIAIFGWGCYSEFQVMWGSSLTGTGYGFLIAVFLFMLFTTYSLYNMRVRGWLQVGFGAREDGSGGSHHHPELRAGLAGSDEYSASADVESAFSYNPSTDTHAIHPKSGESTPTANGGS